MEHSECTINFLVLYLIELNNDIHDYTCAILRILEAATSVGKVYLFKAPISSVCGLI
jgi:hypothetical protein